MPTQAPQTTPSATPENTPVPGGGSWQWDYTTCCWLDNLPATVPAPAPADTTTPTQE
ncbi:MAG: hypothetical protein JZU64_15490 [Rhodoferax sp.]|jgi:hypothetical protein|nr:hypothetical protein [Rhodoferax sp.]